MKAPDPSPRWDWSSWQIDATRRALRTAACESAPGRGEADPSRRCKKKGLYMFPPYGQLGLCRVLPKIWHFRRIMPAERDNAKTLPQGLGGGPVGIPSRRLARGLPDALFHRGLDSPSGHHGDQVRPVVGL